MKSVFALLVCGFALAASSGTKLVSRESDSQWRLPRDILPSNYTIKLLPILEEGNFTVFGSVSIILDCQNETGELLIHSADIDIDFNSVQILELPDRHAVAIANVTLDKDSQFLKILLADDTRFTSGSSYLFSVDFTTKLNDDLRGFYRSSYIEDGEKRYMATTQFSPIDARRAFPCFDEPGFKATFQITLGRKKTMKSASNMPISSTKSNEDLPGYVWDVYEPTLPMSTYIVAFIVSDFVGVEAPREPGETKFTIWSRPSAVNQTEYARQIGPKVLQSFEEYFDVKFPLPKQDMFAVPDFAVGAMENWGLITYRETSLLLDPKKSSATNKQRVASVVAHEIAHQWFGNLVTMHFWSDLWLKEGFASYMEEIGIRAVEPGMETSEQFVNEDLQPAFGLDALVTSRPMSLPVRRPSEINEVFDPVAYQKGPSILRMVASFLGESTFRGGLTRYLNKLKYKNAFQDDLWNALEEQASEDDIKLPTDLNNIMKTWTLQAGFPLVQVTRNYTTGSAVVSQERFLLEKVDQNSTNRWWIPLTYSSNFNKEIQSNWLPSNSSWIEIDDLPAHEKQWVIFNVNQTGFYRVSYDPVNWNLILIQLLEDHGAITSANRAQILDDVLNLARSGDIGYTFALNVTRYLTKEQHYSPWKSAFTAFEFLTGVLKDTEAEKHMKDYLRSIVNPLYEYVGFTGKPEDSHLRILLRSEALKWACSLDIKDCVTNAKNLLGQWIMNPTSEEIISADHLRVVACTGVAKGNQSQWDFVFQKYVQSNAATEKDTLLYALTCSEDSRTLNTLLEWSLDPKSAIRRQDAFAVFQNVASNPVGKSVALNFLISRWKDMTKSFPSLYVLSRIVTSVTKILNKETDLDQLIALKENNKGALGTAVRSIDQAIERTRSNLRWIDNHYDLVLDWLLRLPID